MKIVSLNQTNELFATTSIQLYNKNQIPGSVTFLVSSLSIKL